VLRWHTLLGHVVIPKSSNTQRLAENFSIFDFVLTGEELRRISALDTGDDEILDADRFGH
jgi:2,5-diketo-D-gluconate reductase A